MANLTPANTPPDELQEWEQSLAADVDSLRAEIQTSTATLTLLEQKLALVRQLLSLSGPSALTQSPAAVVHSRPALAAVETAHIEDVVAEVLDGAEAPMHISAIRQVLIDRKFPIPGRGDEANIIVRLRNNPDRFTRTSRGTYALTSWGLPEMKTSRTRRSAKKTR